MAALADQQVEPAGGRFGQRQAGGQDAARPPRVQGGDRAAGLCQAVHWLVREPRQFEGVRGGDIGQWQQPVALDFRNPILDIDLPAIADDGVTRHRAANIPQLVSHFRKRNQARVRHAKAGRGNGGSAHEPDRKSRVTRKPCG